MSDTPRTDAALTTIAFYAELVVFARQLERELNAANKQLQEIQVEVEKLEQDLENYGFKHLV